MERMWAVVAERIPGSLRLYGGDRGGLGRGDAIIAYTEVYE
jgi:hypothetical protein